MKSKLVGNIAERVAGETAVAAGIVSPIPDYRNIDEIDMKAHFKLRDMNDMDLSHMNEEQRSEMNAVLHHVRSWYARTKDVNDAAFVLIGDPGGGKTHIAECVHDSCCTFNYGENLIDLNDPDTLTLTRHSKFYTSGELMLQLADNHGRFTIDKETRLIIIDEIGREGTIPFEKRDFDTQDAAKKHYYFQVINACVGRCALFITSNVTSTQFKLFFDEATYSRIMGMCAPGHMYEMIHVPDYRLVKSGRAQ